MPSKLIPNKALKLILNIIIQKTLSFFFILTSTNRSHGLFCKFLFVFLTSICTAAMFFRYSDLSV